MIYSLALTNIKEKKKMDNTVRGKGSDFFCGKRFRTRSTEKIDIIPEKKKNRRKQKRVI